MQYVTRWSICLEWPNKKKFFLDYIHTPKEEKIHSKILAEARAQTFFALKKILPDGTPMPSIIAFHKVPPPEGYGDFYIGDGDDWRKLT